MKKKLITGLILVASAITIFGAVRGAVNSYKEKNADKEPTVQTQAVVVADFEA